jgi:hypothetical protein
MPTGYPCPNPTCAHVFPPEAVKGAESLTCPHCGTLFRFRAAPPAPPRPTPAARTVPRRPAAVTPRPPAAPPAPRPAAPPPAAPAVPSTADLAPPPDFVAPRLARLRGKGRSGALRRWLPAVVFLLVGAAAAGGGIYLYRAGYLSAVGEAWKPADEAPAGGVLEFPKHNVRLQTADRSWRTEAGIKRVQIDIKGLLVLRREDPNSWLALLAQDYKDRTPQDGELVEEGVRRLREFFKGFEYEVKDKGKDLKLAGQHAVRLEIQGQVNEILMGGECWALGYKGFGYWVVTWAPVDDVGRVAAEWEALRKGLALLKERDGWNGPVVTEAALAGTKADYTLTYVEEVWEKQKPDDYDPRADSALLGRDRTDPKSAARAATAVVLLLDRADDLKAAVSAARARVEKEQKKVAAETTIEEVQEKDPRPDRPPDEIGNVRGRLVRLHVTNSEDRERFVYLAVVAQPERVVAIECECDWRRRPYWEANFDQLLRKFRLKTK